MRRSRRLGTAAGAVALIAIAVVLTLVLRPERDRVEAALAVLDDRGRFTTAVEASDAFAEVTGLLSEADCKTDCARIQRATAWSQVTAVLIIQCAPAAVFEARTELARYVRGSGELPSTPRCGERRQASSS